MMVTKKRLTLAPDHIYVPKHEVMTKKEAEEIKKKLEAAGAKVELKYINRKNLITD